jgi:hypothetical protein
VHTVSRRTAASATFVMLLVLASGCGSSTQVESSPASSSSTTAADGDGDAPDADSGTVSPSSSEVGDTLADADTVITEFLAALSAAQRSLNADVATPTLDRVRQGSDAVALVTMTSAAPVHVAPSDVAPCGEGVEPCATEYAYALARFDFDVDSVRALGIGESSVVAGDPLSLTQGVGVVGTNAVEVNAQIEGLRTELVARAPIGTRSVLFLRNSSDGRPPAVVAWAVVGTDGSLTSTFAPPLETEERVWTESVPDLDALAALE